MSKTQSLRIIVTGGGTGGHLFPGIAVAEALRERFPGSGVMFVGTARHVDAQALAGRGLRTETVRCQGLKGKSPGAFLAACCQLPLGLLQAFWIMWRFRPHLVLGVGGYVTGPVVLAAKLMGVATCIHEQNSIPGLANRLLGRLVDRIFISLPGSEGAFPAGKTVLTGNPVRRELIMPVDTGHRGTAAGKNGPVLLVLGGSQGAHRVNQLVTGALAGSKERLPEGFSVIHQTGGQDEAWVRECYEKAGIRSRVAAFIKDMGPVYRAADLVVSRAGATTLAEITLLGKPSVLIPFPFAADDHQARNGQIMARAGAAELCVEATLTEEILGEKILALLGDEKRRREMARGAMNLARPRATEAIVEECLDLLPAFARS